MAFAVPKEVLLQMGIYLFIFVAVLVFMMIWFRGFFWKYYRVKVSYGSKILIKVRTSLRDYFEVGWVEEEMLIYKQHGKRVELAMPNDFNPIYRCIGVNWIDVDEARNAIVKPDFSTVPGYDAQKFSNLHTRALTQPQVNSNNEKIIFIMLVIIILALFGCLYLSWNNYDNIHKLAINIPEWLKNIKMTVTGGGV